MNKTSERCVGIVDSVSSPEVKAFLLDEAPSNVAISYGTFSLFPRINGYLVIPNETGLLVGITTWIGYNHVNVQNDVDLPKGTRMVYLSILGHIENTLTGKKFERGVFSLPTVGDQVLLPTEKELELINKLDSNASFEIGTSPLLANQPIKLPINELFGRHIAVLGNTGSGKSCTVAGLVRWSVEESERQCGHSPNSRYIILDPNGEYGHAFNDLNMEVIRYSVKEFDESFEQLRVPAWMWNSEEWASVFQASDKVQKPILREALRDLRSSNVLAENGKSPLIQLEKRLSYLHRSLKVAVTTQSFLSSDGKNNFGKELEQRIESLKILVPKLDEDLAKVVSAYVTVAEQVKDGKKKSFSKNGDLIQYYDPFNPSDIESLVEKIEAVIGTIGHNNDFTTDISEDDPVEFTVNDLASYIDTIAEGKSSAQFVDFMTVRIRSLLANTTLSPVIGDTQNISLLEWINSFLGSGNDKKGKICVIDLSLLPTNITHLIVSTISRLIFEALQRYRKHYGSVLPTILVMDEAHTFIHKINENASSSAELCTHVFERIAREGRKYGLGLIVSSQRPSELSATVLSQCNSFILHRIVNDRDQEMVKRLVPDNLGNLLNELPALPTQKAIILGSVVSVPALVEMRSLNLLYRPHSETPDFWKAWTESTGREIDWKEVVDEWQKKGNETM
ncbi:ATP-binding protein [Lactobacillus delbrueckii]|uniref:ATP-binding protein n=1 Tax=Lactobacillus delbrueckii TaxID=1584 RepID=UPI001F2D569E|nr:ATP-binding protein [Lactobacillus delbrueckii]GHN40357.1 ATPase [Lactobacillus delbrueckii]